MAELTGAIRETVRQKYAQAADGGGAPAKAAGARCSGRSPDAAGRVGQYVLPPRRSRQASSAVAV